MSSPPLRAHPDGRGTSFALFSSAATAVELCLFDEAGAEHIVTHEPRVASSEFGVLRQCAIAGLGVAFLPEFACREPLADGRLERILPGWIGREGILHLVFTSRRGLLPSVRAVIDFLAAVLDPRSIAWPATL